MKNNLKGFINLIIAIIIILLIGGGIYVYKEQMSQPVTENNVQHYSDLATTTLTIPTLDVSNQLPISLNILPDTYDTLTEYEKTLINKIKSSSVLANSYLKGVTPKLKFYDNKTVVFSLPVKKDIAILYIYDINTLENINVDNLEINLINKYNNYTETSDYIIAIGSINYGPYDTNNDRDILLFYKKGEMHFQTVPNSQLIKTETYFKDCVSADSCVTDFTFNEPTKTITASVFEIKENLPNVKIRTMKFVLP